MDRGSQTELHIRRLSQGGYVVRDGISDPGRYNDDLFASEDIDEALHFIREMMFPIGPQPPQTIGIGIEDGKIAN